MRKFKLILSAVALLAASVMSFAQNVNVRGVVKDAAGEPVPGGERAGADTRLFRRTANSRPAKRPGYMGP